jgi:heme/copper-type cytochrome/quinol oxidase subunit 3
MDSPVATTRSSTGINTGVLALYWVIISEIVIFGGLLACYILFRIRHGEAWSKWASSTYTLAGGINTFILLTSSYFAVLAHDAAVKKDTERSSRFLLYTIFGGCGFLIVKSYEYGMKFSHGITILTNNFWSFYYVSTGLHGLHVIAGMVAMIIVRKQVKAGQHLNRVELCGLYWHFVDIVWIFLFPLLYIAK